MSGYIPMLPYNPDTVEFFQNLFEKGRRVGKVRLGSQLRLRLADIVDKHRSAGLVMLLRRPVAVLIGARGRIVVIYGDLFAGLDRDLL